jgi:hypothetical protein
MASRQRLPFLVYNASRSPGYPFFHAHGKSGDPLAVEEKALAVEAVPRSTKA